MPKKYQLPSEKQQGGEKENHSSLGRNLKLLIKVKSTLNKMQAVTFKTSKTRPKMRIRMLAI